MSLWKPTSQYLRVCFTVNLPVGKTWADYDLKKLIDHLRPSFLIAGKEEVGRKHFQGYMEFERKKLGSAMDTAFRRIFPLPISVYFALAKGSGQQNVDYCSKTDKEAFKWGTMSQGQGARNDLGQMFQNVKDGASDADLVNTDAEKWAVHRRALQEYRQMLAPKRTTPSELLFLWGPTGTGKTAAAMEGAADLEVVDRENGRFLIGYTGAKEIVLFDDFDWSSMTPKFFLRLIDRYPLTVEGKGTTINFAPKKIIFTSNDDPKTWWPDAPEPTREAIHRRMEEFGTTKFLGTAVPRGQKPPAKLTSFFKTATPAAVASSAGGGGGVSACAVAITPEAIVVDDSDDDHSVASNIERSAKRLKRAPGCRSGHMCNAGECFCF